MGIRTVIVLSILAMVFAVIVLLVWIDQRRQQKRLRAIARYNRENRERKQQGRADSKTPEVVELGDKRMIIDPLVADSNDGATGSLDGFEGILSAPRIVSQASSSTAQSATNLPPGYKAPTLPTARTVQVSSSTSAATRTPRITPYSKPGGQPLNYRSAQSAARTQTAPQPPLNPMFSQPDFDSEDDSTDVLFAPSHSKPAQLQSNDSLTESAAEISSSKASPTSYVRHQALYSEPTPTVAAEESSAREASIAEQTTDTQKPSESIPHATTASTTALSSSAQKTAALPEYLTFSLMAEKDKPFGGYDLLQAILGSGLRHGERQIFHRYDVNKPTKILFSLASIAKPGTFSLDTMGAFSTPGLIFIFEIEQTADLLNTFELLLETARQLNDELDGNLLDNRREPLTTERIQALRQQLREITPVADFVDDD
jgi:cell division protein ZipA